jgi:hypothetical protein
VEYSGSMPSVGMCASLFLVSLIKAWLIKLDPQSFPVIVVSLLPSISIGRGHTGWGGYCIDPEGVLLPHLVSGRTLERREP